MAAEDIAARSRLIREASRQAARHAGRATWYRTTRRMPGPYSTRTSHAVPRMRVPGTRADHG